MLSDERIRQIAEDIYCSEGTRAEIEHSIRFALAELAAWYEQRITDLEDVLRSLVCSLSAGGYNADVVDPAVFEKKIRDGINMLTAPLQERIRQLEAQRVPDIRCKCCGYLVTESEHRGCLRSAIDGHLLASLRLAAEALHALTDRNITYIGNDAVLPFESNAQAFNHMIDARRHAKEAMEMLAAAIAKAKGETK